MPVPVAKLDAIDRTLVRRKRRATPAARIRAERHQAEQERRDAARRLELMYQASQRLRA